MIYRGYTVERDGNELVIKLDGIEMHRLRDVTGHQVGETWPDEEGAMNWIDKAKRDQHRKGT